MTPNKTCNQVQRSYRPEKKGINPRTIKILIIVVYQQQRTELVVFYIKWGKEISTAV